MVGVRVLGGGGLGDGAMDSGVWNGLRGREVGLWGLWERGGEGGGDDG
jgi:hypothetical protein